MAFRGLFIGVDRYQSPAIGELNCASRDAIALNALFASAQIMRAPVYVFPAPQGRRSGNGANRR